MKFSLLLEDGGGWGKFRFKSQGKVGNLSWEPWGYGAGGTEDSLPGKSGTGVNVRDKAGLSGNQDKGAGGRGGR